MEPLIMSDTKKKRGGQFLYDGIEPKKFSFKAHPTVKDSLDTIQADLESEGVNATHSAIIRTLITASIPNAVEIILNHVEGKGSYGIPNESETRTPPGEIATTHHASNG